jgi:hypothetical protein
LAGAAEVDLFRLWSRSRLDPICIAGRHNAIATNRQRLHIKMSGIAGKDLAVVEDQIRSRLLRETEVQKQRAAKPSKAIFRMGIVTTRMASP